MLVGGLCGIYYGSFSLYLLPGFPIFDYLHSASGAFLPAAVFGFFGQLLRKDKKRGPVSSRKLWALTVLVVIACLSVHAYLYADVPRASVAEVSLAVFVFGGFGFTLRALWLIQRATENQVERARLGYLLSLLLGAVAFSGLETLIRNAASATDLSQLSIVTRSMVLQGAFPPIGAVAGTLFCYFLYQVVERYRLLDLFEVFARLFTLAAASLVLVAIDGITVIWIGSFSEFPIHATFQIFMASVFFLGIYDPLRKRIETAAGEWFNRQGRRLELTLNEIERDLRKVISIESLEHHVIQRLQQSGRAPQVSLYLWNQERHLYEIALEQGLPDRPLMRTIAQHPFTDGFLADGSAYNRTGLDTTVKRRLSGHEDAVLRLRTMDTMAADLTLPIVSGDLVLGWLNFRDESWSDGYSSEEVRRLTQTVNRVAVVLENIYSFEQLKEQTRLAALGTMSAGLAHEIRNPLAGIKGAAQYLQGDADPAEVQTFLKVIVDETDRLNTVVSQFLAYARPFQIHGSLTLANHLVEGVLGLVRAEGLPDGVEMITELAPGIPRIHMDPDKLRQVLLNLIKNALQAIDDEGRITVRTGLGTLMAPPHRGNPSFVVSVADTGAGIVPENLEKLFIPFFTTKPEGTGLGLAISRRIVEAHGGEIAVQSRQGEGTRFTVRLPLLVPDLDPDQTLS